jgi:hypothetical protein
LSKFGDYFGILFSAAVVLKSLLKAMFWEKVDQATDFSFHSLCIQQTEI